MPLFYAIDYFAPLKQFADVDLRWRRRRAQSALARASVEISLMPAIAAATPPTRSFIDTRASTTPPMSPRRRHAAFHMPCCRERAFADIFCQPRRPPPRRLMLSSPLPRHAAAKTISYTISRPPVVYAMVFAMPLFSGFARQTPMTPPVPCRLYATIRRHVTPLARLITPPMPADTLPDAHILACCHAAAADTPFDAAIRRAVLLPMRVIICCRAA